MEKTELKGDFCSKCKARMIHIELYTDYCPICNLVHEIDTFTGKMHIYIKQKKVV